LSLFLSFLNPYYSFKVDEMFHQPYQFELDYFQI